MKRLAIIAGLLMLTTTALIAQAQLPTKRVLTLNVAKKIAAAAEAEALKRGSTVVIAVVDDGGYLLVLERLDDTQVASVEVGIAKARTAAIFRRPSKVFEDQVREGRVAALGLPGAAPLQGGIPIVFESKVIGAIGVSGNTPQEDEDIAKVGAAALEGTYEYSFALSWMRYAKLEFYKGEPGPIAITPSEVNVEVVRKDPAINEIIGPNPKIFKLAEGFKFTEGPVWVKDGGYLLFSDPNSNIIYKYKPNGSDPGKLEVFRTPSGYSGADLAEYGQPGSNGLTFDSQGRLTINEHGNHRVNRLEKDGRETVLADRYQGKRLNSPNDLVYRS